MCGIIGYTGKENAFNIVQNGLKILEYRGYDSVGMALDNGKEVKCFKAIGASVKLFESLDANENYANSGIGHCRWATCGKVTMENAHPQRCGKVYLVHNGIIENYKQLIEEFHFTNLTSQTDTEVIAHLIDYFYDGDPVKAIYHATKYLEGSYAIVVMFSGHHDCLYACRKVSPLVFAKNEKGIAIASELLPLNNGEYKYSYDLVEKDILAVIGNEFTIYDSNLEKTTYSPIEIKKEDIASKNGFSTFLEKEIYQQPEVLQQCLDCFNNEHFFPNITKQQIEKIKRIYLIACGTSHYASLVIKNNIQKYLHIDCASFISSEFQESEPIIDKDTLVIAISQSGETIDTILAVQYAKEKGAKILSLVNVENSLLVKISDYHIVSPAKREMSVASTKAYSSQVMILNLFILYLTQDKVLIENELEKLKKIPSAVQTILNEADKLNKVVQQEKDKTVILLGRGLDYLTLLEGALKVKELAYMNINAYPAGELKHGPLAIVDENTLVLGLCTQKELYPKMLNNLNEVKARKGNVIFFVSKQLANNSGYQEIVLPEMPEEYSNIVSVAVFQLLALKLAQSKGYNVDKPRNLAKVVTVE